MQAVVDKESGVTQSLLRVIGSSETGSTMSGVRGGPFDPVCLAFAAAFGVFARLLLHNSAAFLQFFQRAAAALPGPRAALANGLPAEPAQALLLAYLDLWWVSSNGCSVVCAARVTCGLICTRLRPLYPWRDVSTIHATAQMTRYAGHKFWHVKRLDGMHCMLCGIYVEPNA